MYLVRVNLIIPDGEIQVVKVQTKFMCVMSNYMSLEAMTEACVQLKGTCLPEPDVESFVVLAKVHTAHVRWRKIFNSENNVSHWYFI